VLPLGANTYSSAYYVGEIAGFVFILVLARTVVYRALTRGFGRGGESGPGQGHGISPRRGRTRRDLVIAAIAVVVAGVYIVSAIHRPLGSSSGESWASSQGVNVKAGYLAGCAKGGQQYGTCECLFDRISAVAPFNTPAGFTGLQSAVRRADETRDAAYLPGAVLTAFRDCAHTAS
jgi:hypothetical protein